MTLDQFRIVVGLVAGRKRGPIPTGTEASICEDLASRQAKGIAKYGVTVTNNPLRLRAWLQHAYEECLDQAVYLKRAIEQIDKETRE